MPESKLSAAFQAAAYAASGNRDKALEVLRNAHNLPVVAKGHNNLVIEALELKTSAASLRIHQEEKMAESAQSAADRRRI